MSKHSSTNNRTARFTDMTIDLRNARGRVTPYEDLDHAEMRSDAAEIKANEISLVRARLAASATGTLGRAAETAIRAGNRKMDQPTYDRFRGEVSHALRMADQDAQLRALEREYRERIVIKDRDYYAKDSPHSFFADSLQLRSDAGSAIANRIAPGAEERLATHGRLVAAALDKRSKYGRLIERYYVEQYRSRDVAQNERTATRQLSEFRTMLTTGGGATASASGGGIAAFVPPYALLSEFATYRSPRAVICGQLNTSEDLPAYGMAVMIPSIGAPTSVTTTSEGSAVSEGDPQPVSFVPAAIANYSGKVELSQAVYDRVGPGMSADLWIIRQIKDQLQAAIDLAAITVWQANDQTVTDNGTFLVVGVTGLGTNSVARDVAKAKALLTDTAGVRIRASHLFATSDVLDTFASWGDAQGRPLLPFHRDPDGTPDDDGDGYVADFFGLRGYAADNIVTTGGTSNIQQLIVTRPSTTLLMQGAPRAQVFPQYPGGLNPVIVVDQYAAVAPRFPTAVVTISGTAYAGSNFA